MQRRSFLKNIPLASASLWLPRFLQAQAQPGLLRPNGKILVMLQLSGGNDGLNTLAPISNDIYYRERPRIAIDPKEALRLTEHAGLHPSLTALRSLYDKGHLAVLNSVGYPNPDRSHFRSMDIWHTGSPADEYWSQGWLGRYLDAQCGEQCPRATGALEIDDTLGLALKGAQNNGLALQNPQRLYEMAHSAYFEDYAAATANTTAPDDHPVGYLYKTMRDALSSADYLLERSKAKTARGNYPDSELGRHFQTIASLILADADTSVYYVSHGSFDTHVNQQGQQKRLFEDMNQALEAFAATLQEQGRWQDVLVVTFSEFGRRVAQNASNGTDHGAANLMFFAGGGLKKSGILNGMPDLSQLTDGDLPYDIDFRRVYATLLENWLGVDAKAVLGGEFGRLGFV